MNELKYQDDFPNINTWIESKVIRDTEFIKNILGETNYKNFKKRLSASKPKLTELNFAQILITQLELLKFSSSSVAERNIIDAVLYSLNLQYSNEKKEFINQKNKQIAFNKFISEKVETYFLLLEYSSEGFIEDVEDKLDSADYKPHIMTKYAEFKRVVYDNFAELGKQNRPPNDEDYISIIMSQRQIALDRVISELEEKEDRKNNNRPPLSFDVKLSDLVREIDNKICTICCVEYNNENLLILECSHLFHKDCVNKWFLKQTNCPTCRK